MGVPGEGAEEAGLEQDGDDPGELPVALEAEMLAKTALLCGPQDGRELLAHHGGALILDDGELSVSLGLAMSSRLLRRPGLPAKLKRWHEASTLVTLGLIAAHGGVLLLDGDVRPSLAGVTLPFALAYRPFWTGLGVIGAWLALILAMSFYVRRWIGPKTWRWMHRWTLAVNLLALVHTVGAGTDGRAGWMLVLLTVLVAPNVLGVAYRLLPGTRPTRTPKGGTRQIRKPIRST